MWFTFAVTAVKPTGPKKAAHVFLKRSYNGSTFEVNDASLAAFCFPLGADSQTPKDRMAPEEYTFTLTQGNGSRVQGFCRRFLPPAPRVGSRLRYPQVLCLVCKASWAALFFKALEVTEQLLCQTELLLDLDNAQLPASSYAGTFLSALEEQLADKRPLGSIIRVPLPRVPAPLSVSPPKMAVANGGCGLAPLLCTSDALELQIPPDSGNGYSNAGVSLARLLWHVPVPAMVTLVASLLMERRVILVGQSRDVVSAAVCAANALLYPFKWHHIYLPLLPRSFTDYLTAPMPFLIGLPAQLLPVLRGIPMNEVTMIDLDLGKCEPAPGSPLDDSHHLPWRDMLEGALQAAFGMLRSPTEHESNPLISSIIQGYVLKLLGNYRSFINPEPPRQTPPGHGLPQANAPPSPHGSSSSSAARGTPPLARQSMPLPSRAAVDGDAIRGSGYWFDHAGLVASHRHNEKARSFLTLMRQSQMYEVFIQERLKMAADCGYRRGNGSGGAAAVGGAVPQTHLVSASASGLGGGVTGGTEDGWEGWDEGGDPFEERVSAYLENRQRRLAARLNAGMRSSLSRFQAFVRKHRRTDSAPDVDVQRAKQLATAFMQSSLGAVRRTFEGAAAAAAAAGLPGDEAAAVAAAAARGGSITVSGASISLGNIPALLSPRAAEGSGGSPLRGRHGHSMSMDQISGRGGLVVRSGGSCTAGSPGLAPSVAESGDLLVMDPSAFFQDDDEEVDEADAAAAAAAAERGGGRLSRNTSASSLNSLGGLSSGPSFSSGAALVGSGAGLASRQPSVSAAPGAGGRFTTPSAGPFGSSGAAPSGTGQGVSQHALQKLAEQRVGQLAALQQQQKQQQQGALGEEPLIELWAGGGRRAATQQQRPQHQQHTSWGAPPLPKPVALLGAKAAASRHPNSPPVALVQLPQPPAPRHSLHMPSHFQQQQQQQQDLRQHATTGAPDISSRGISFTQPTQCQWSMTAAAGPGKAAPPLGAPADLHGASQGENEAGTGGNSAAFELVSDDPFAMLLMERTPAVGGQGGAAGSGGGGSGSGGRGDGDAAFPRYAASEGATVAVSVVSLDCRSSSGSGESGAAPGMAVSSVASDGLGSLGSGGGGASGGGCEARVSGAGEDGLLALAGLSLSSDLQEHLLQQQKQQISRSGGGGFAPEAKAPYHSAPALQPPPAGNQSAPGRLDSGTGPAGALVDGASVTAQGGGPLAAGWGRSPQGAGEVADLLDLEPHGVAPAWEQQLQEQQHQLQHQQYSHVDLL